MPDQFLVEVLLFANWPSFLLSSLNSSLYLVHCFYRQSSHERHPFIYFMNWLKSWPHWTISNNNNFGISKLSKTIEREALSQPLFKFHFCFQIKNNLSFLIQNVNMYIIAHAVSPPLSFFRLIRVNSDTPDNRELFTRSDRKRSSLIFVFCTSFKLVCILIYLQKKHLKSNFLFFLVFQMFVICKFWIFQCRQKRWVIRRRNRYQFIAPQVTPPPCLWMRKNTSVIDPNFLIVPGVRWVIWWNNTAS